MQRILYVFVTLQDKYESSQSKVQDKCGSVPSSIKTVHITTLRINLFLVHFDLWQKWNVYAFLDTNILSVVNKAI